MQEKQKELEECKGYFISNAMDNRKKLYGMRLGKKHWKSRPFTVNGKKFYTLREAGENLKVHLSTIQKRLENSNMSNYKYV